jgi:hypothetical protein
MEYSSSPDARVWKKCFVFFWFEAGPKNEMQERFASRAVVDDAWLCFAWIITGNELIARALAIYMLRGAAAFCVFTVLGLLGCAALRRYIGPPRE